MPQEPYEVSLQKFVNCANMILIKDRPYTIHQAAESCGMDPRTVHRYVYVELSEVNKRMPPKKRVVQKPACSCYPGDDGRSTSITRWEPEFAVQLYRRCRRIHHGRRWAEKIICRKPTGSRWASVGSRDRIAFDLHLIKKQKVGNWRRFDCLDYLNGGWYHTNLPFDVNQYNELGKQTVLCRILTHIEIYGLTCVYDVDFTIYRHST